MQATKAKAGERVPVEKVVKAKVGEKDPAKAMERAKACRHLISWAKGSGEVRAIGMARRNGKGENGGHRRAGKGLDISDLCRPCKRPLRSLW